MSDTPELRVLHAARIVADDVNRLLRGRRLFNTAQLRRAAESIPANIQEGMGRDVGPDRNQFLRVARGSAEETNDRLRTRLGAGDISEKVYWPQHHRLVSPR